MQAVRPSPKAVCSALIQSEQQGCRPLLLPCSCSFPATTQCMYSGTLLTVQSELCSVTAVRTAQKNSVKSFKGSSRSSCCLCYIAALHSSVCTTSTTCQRGSKLIFVLKQGRLLYCGHFGLYTAYYCLQQPLCGVLAAGRVAPGSQLQLTLGRPWPPCVVPPYYSTTVYSSDDKNNSGFGPPSQQTTEW